MFKNQKKKSNKKGFSLVELIVVIAIMALLIAILAPSLLAYVERSRAQKDDSAMSEVTNAIQLALADQDIYDEVLYYTTYGNVSCYIDESSENAIASDEHVGGAINATVTKEVDGGDSWKNQYLFGDNARLADEAPYYFAGNMRGVTITFQPVKSSNASKIVLANGVINKALRTAGTGATVDVAQDTNLIAANRVADSETYINATPDYTGAGTFGTMASGSSGNTYLYNRVRATIGDEIELTSQTYRNSEYTVFIRVGSTGGNQASAQDAIAVYGQWNGTNLPANATSINDDGNGGPAECTISDDCPALVIHDPDCPKYQPNGSVGDKIECENKIGCKAKDEDHDDECPEKIGYATFNKYVTNPGVCHADRFHNDDCWTYCEETTLTWQDLQKEENGIKYGYDYTKITDGTLGDSAFMGCGPLVSITIPTAITQIGGYALSNCRYLTNVTVPSNVTNFGNCVFYYNVNLTTIKFTGTVDQWNNSISKGDRWNWTYTSTIVKCADGDIPLE